MRVLLVVVVVDDDDALARARQRWSRSRCGAWLSCFNEEVDKKHLVTSMVRGKGSVFMCKKR